MPSVVTRIELDIEQLVAHVRSMLEKDVNVEIHINPPADTTIRVGGPHPNTAGSEPGGPGQHK